jgi:hypothetical protein
VPRQPKEKVSNERKNLHRLAGEFLVASRLTQRGYMVSLQWGTTIGYDLLVYDKAGKVAFLEVKSTASTHERWILQKKYAHPRTDAISSERRFVCCVDLTAKEAQPSVYVFPAEVVAKALHYFYSSKFSASESYMLHLRGKPRGKTKDENVQTVGQYIGVDKYLEGYGVLGISTVER